MHTILSGCLIWGSLLGFMFQVSAQSQWPETSFSKAACEAHIRFLAADELAGRRTGEPGNHIAARYLISQFQAYGVQSLSTLPDYSQVLPFEEIFPPTQGSLSWVENTYQHGEEMVILNGMAADIQANAVFAGYGLVDPETGRDDYAGLEVEGKIVVVNSGLPGTDDAAATVQAMSHKRAWAAERGAVALIELYRLSMPWRFVRRFMNRTRLSIAPEPPSELPHVWIEDAETKMAQALQQNQPVALHLQSPGVKRLPRPAVNVVGWIPGTDPRLQKEYVVVSAHFDHVGTGKKGGRITASDSIFNGARDNAIGTTALLATAQALAQKPARRPILLMGFNAEEMGLLGSQYYVEHPAIPLKQTRFVLNCDGAGYNDTSRLSVIGFDHVEAQTLVESGAKPFGLEVGGDPVPEQNLYDRSDNAPFAQAGVPALNLSPGVSSFDQSLMQYYHQVADEAESLNFDYVSRFCRAFAHTVRIVADQDKLPYWQEGAKYEAAGQQLYQN